MKWNRIWAIVIALIGIVLVPIAWQGELMAITQVFLVILWHSDRAVSQWKGSNR